MPLSGEAGSFAVLVEEQPLAPGISGGETIPQVVDHRGAGAFPGGDDGQHGRVALVGLVVEDHRVELSLTLLGDGEKCGLGADQHMRVARRQDLPGLIAEVGIEARQRATLRSRDLEER